MARRSVLSSLLEQQETLEQRETSEAPGTIPAAQTPIAPSSPKPSRQAKLHIGGYFDPDGETIVAFQKLKVDLRKSQQEMLLDALRDFVDKQRVAPAFR